MVVAYGMTTIMVYGSIFNGLRQSIHNAGSEEGFSLTRPTFKFISEFEYLKRLLLLLCYIIFSYSLTLF